MIHGFTFEDCYQPGKIRTFLKTFSKRMMIRLVCDTEESGFDWKAMVATCKYLSPVCDIMICISDSYYFKNYSVKEYEERTKQAIGLLGKYANHFEAGNEIGGEWLGESYDVKTKVERSAEIIRKAGLKSVITYYYAGESPNLFWNAVDEVGGCDWALVSWYPNWTPSVRPNWNEIFLKLFNKKKCPVAFGEFGTEPRKWSDIKTAGFIREMLAKKISVPAFGGGYFYWDGSQLLEKGYRHSALAFQKEWGKA